MTDPVPTHAYLRAAGAGIATGMRTWPGLTAATYAVQNDRLDADNDLLGDVLRARPTGALIAIAAVGELIVDKLPATPSRRQPAPLLGRTAFGGVAGAIVARGYGGSGLAGAVIGAAAAFLSTHLFGLARVRIVEWTGLPDVVIAVVEDGLALTTAYLSANGWVEDDQAMKRPPSTVST